MQQLQQIQAELKAPKNQFNNFGKYKYRSQEDILEALKPLLAKYGCTLTVSDKVHEVAGLAFIEATAIITNGSETVSVTAQAGIDAQTKGMSIAQCFGSSSSYARKYALNGLFLIDDTKDADATNTHGHAETQSDVPTKAEIDLLIKMLANIPEDKRGPAMVSINGIKTYADYDRIRIRLGELQTPIDQIVNPSQKDISNHLKKTVK